VQNAIAGVEVPFGTRVLVNNRQTELILAERFLRRAVELEPGNAEAQLRYGWVLVQQKRLDPAFDALRAARATATESVLQYYALLFLAVAESAAGRHDAAIDLFEQAAPLFPTAQAPLLALSELAMRRGDRAASAAALQRLFGLPPLERVDPWWTYGTEYGRHWRASWSRVLEGFSGPKSTAPRRQAGTPCVALR
jgi:tetratricopeptide (TPR) repeat protein